MKRCQRGEKKKNSHAAAVTVIVEKVGFMLNKLLTLLSRWWRFVTHKGKFSSFRDEREIGDEKRRESKWERCEEVWEMEEGHFLSFFSPKFHFLSVERQLKLAQLGNIQNIIWYASVCWNKFLDSSLEFQYCIWWNTFTTWRCVSASSRTYTVHWKRGNTRGFKKNKKNKKIAEV